MEMSGRRLQTEEVASYNKPQVGSERCVEDFFTHIANRTRSPGLSQLV
jgi:hypothetical protein